MRLSLKCRKGINTMRNRWIIVALATSAAFAGPVAAQNPSADQIIQSLRPGGLSMTTRGIRPMAPTPDSSAAPVSTAPSGGGAAPRPAPHAPPVAAQASPPPPAPSVNLTVQFQTGSAELSPAATQTLDELGRALSSSALAGYRFRIEGHTDTVGTRAGNQALSEARAAKVLDYLSSKWSVSRDKVMTVGMGEDHLLVRTGPNVPEPRNRRVTVINLGA
jgi:OOP family OmpA-OmpF porin